MALSPGHKLGQIIGDMLEAAIEPMLQDFAAAHGLYLDKKGPRASRSGTKVRLIDEYANSHDLDYVLEVGATATQMGRPIAFIEVAWRNYTKHSRAKAQEIQGAVLPLADKYRRDAPFKGAIIAGVFTLGARTQLESLGFTFLYFPLATLIAAFQTVGINIVFDASTPDRELQQKVDSWIALSPTDRQTVAQMIIRLNQSAVAEFMAALERTLTRYVVQVIILPLHGELTTLPSIPDAIAFIDRYDQSQTAGLFARYEIQIKYSNDDRVEGQFAQKTDAISFLHNFLPASQ